MSLSFQHQGGGPAAGAKPEDIRCGSEVPAGVLSHTEGLRYSLLLKLSLYNHLEKVPVR